jgi:excisionase family DNA binding protein
VDTENTIQPLLVDASTASQMLAISKRTLATLVAEQQIPTTRVRRCLRFSVADLEQYCDARRDGGSHGHAG